MISVLCINDSDINLFLQKRLLLLSGITNKVITVNDGKKALDYYAKLQEEGSEEYPALVLLDIHMPNVDGWEFLDKFTETYLPVFKNTNVVINSYTVDEEEINKAKDYPVVIDFVTGQLTANYFNKLELSPMLRSLTDRTQLIKDSGRAVK